jgi:hypothetical protein
VGGTVTGATVVAVVAGVVARVVVGTVTTGTVVASSLRPVDGRSPPSASARPLRPPTTTTVDPTTARTRVRCEMKDRAMT